MKNFFVCVFGLILLKLINFLSCICPVDSRITTALLIEGVCNLREEEKSDNHSCCHEPTCLSLDCCFQETLHADEGCTGICTYWEPLRIQSLLRRDALLNRFKYIFFTYTYIRLIECNTSFVFLPQGADSYVKLYFHS